eukprot:TRINITY_DN598_c2_g1_i3.p1 TRINITY_DN598_c2_g1~~TRINITY_DN598_c2_g1_i3.p1  ORF type:complete len:165 (-),score=61.41 TRINITY_DN598_c2_g1_i3:92-586(-)
MNDLTQVKALDLVTSPVGNFILYRNKLSSTTKPAIPHLAIHLTDILHFRDAKKTETTATVTTTTTTTFTPPISTPTSPSPVTTPLTASCNQVVHSLTPLSTSSTPLTTPTRIHSTSHMVLEETIGEKKTLSFLKSVREKPEPTGERTLREKKTNLCGKKSTGDG